MKITIWDILSIVMILSTLCLCGVFGVIASDENSFLNPFPRPTALPTISIEIPPTATATPTTRLNVMPPTWTPTPPEGGENGGSTVPTARPSSTPLPTFTSYVIPSFTPSATITYTPTNTATITSTATQTPPPTFTPFPTDTPPPTNTPAP